MRYSSATAERWSHAALTRISARTNQERDSTARVLNFNSVAVEEITRLLGDFSPQL